MTAPDVLHTKLGFLCK